MENCLKKFTWIYLRVIKPVLRVQFVNSMSICVVLGKPQDSSSTNFHLPCFNMVLHSLKMTIHCSHIDLAHPWLFYWCMWMISSWLDQVQLQSLFKLKVLGSLKYSLGLEIAKSSKGISLSQRKYTLSLLDDTGFLGSKLATLPMDSNLKLGLVDGDPIEDPSLYKRMIGRLMYLTIYRQILLLLCTRLFNI